MKPVKTLKTTLFPRLKKHYWPLIIILLLATLPRLYNVTNRYSLGFEAIRDVTVGMYSAQYLQLPLTGPFSSLGAFTFGPWYWYLLAFSYVLIPWVYAGWLMMSLLSVFQVFFMYKIGEELLDRKLAIVLAILAACSPYLVDTSTALSNPNPLHFFAAGSIYFFLRALRNHSHWGWSLLMGLWIGMGFFSHYQMIAYLSLPAAMVVWKRFNVKHMIGSITALFITYLPMLVFDLLNNWHQLRNIVFSYMDMGNRIYLPNSWRIYLFDFWPHAWANFWNLPMTWSIGLLIFVMGGCVWLIIKKKFNRKLWLLSLLFILMFVHLRYYKGERFMGYVHYTFPFLLLYTALAFRSLSEVFKKQYLFIFSVVAFVSLLTPRLIQAVSSSTEILAFNQLGKALSTKYPNQQFKPYHCLLERNEEASNSIVFLLIKEKLYADDGQPLLMGDTHCIGLLDESLYRRVELKNNSSLGYTAELFEFYGSQEDLVKAKYTDYTLKTLYKQYALWWLDSTIK